jgi:putative FmdB family regulatory protein
MPIYEYRRKDGTTFEVIQKFSDDPLTTDPETGDPVERVYSAPAIHFKGSGFHNTDYSSGRRARSGAGTAGGEGDSSDSGNATGKSDSASDAAKSEPKAADKSPSAKPAKSDGSS